MVAWPVRLAETGTGILRRRVVEAAFHGGDDGVVARAAAEVPGVPSADFLAGNGLAFVFFDEGRTAHDEAGRAEAALDGPGVHIGLLDAGKPVVVIIAALGIVPKNIRVTARKIQESTGVLSTSTVHAPHSPTPQPCLELVRPSARRTSSSEARTSKESSRALPLTVQRMVFSMRRPPEVRRRGRRTGQ